MPQLTNTTKVNFTISNADYNAATRFFRRSKSVTRWRIIVFLVAITIAAAALIPPLTAGSPILQVHLMFVAVAIVVFFLGWRTVSGQSLPERSGQSMPATVAFSSAGITCQTPTQASWFSWNTVSHIHDTSSHLFISIAERDIVIIPRSTSQCDLPWPELVAQIKSLRANTKSFQPFCPECGFNLSHLPLHGCPECGWGRSSTPQGAA